jgi:hypothetical protein
MYIPIALTTRGTPKTVSDELEEVKAQIRLYRLRGQYIEGHEYICSLARDLRKRQTIAIETAQLYLVQGDYIRAAEECALAHKSIFSDEVERNEFSSEVFNVDSVCLELVSAYIDISRRCKLKSALHLSQRVYDVWLGPSIDSNIDLTNSLSSEEQAVKVSEIEAQRLALEKVMVDLEGADDVFISKSRVYESD